MRLLRTPFQVLLCSLMFLSGCAPVNRRIHEVPLYVEENARELVKEVNRYRMRHDLPPLMWDSYLYLVCVAHCEDMREREFFSHYSPDHEGPFERLDNARLEYTWAAENLACGQTSADKVLSDWLRSPAHRRNIESSLYTYHAVAYDPDGHYWTHMFIDCGSQVELIMQDTSHWRRIRHRTRL